MTKVIKKIVCQNHSSIFVYGLILMKIFMNANVMKITYNLKSPFILWRSFAIFFTLRSFDLITTLSHVLMDNFCPFSYFISKYLFKNSVKYKVVDNIYYEGMLFACLAKNMIDRIISYKRFNKSFIINRFFP